MSDCAQTPLLDLLRSVPLDARLSYKHSPTDYSMIPAGRLCNEAADEIEALRELAAEPVQEPVATVGLSADMWKGYGPTGQWFPPGEPLKTVHLLRDLPIGTMLYAAPQQRVEPVQGEPVAWMHFGKVFDTLEKAQHDEMRHRSGGFKPKPIIPLYAHPPQQRKPLTRGEIVGMWGDRSDGPANHEIISFARAIEAAHGITEAT